MECTEPISLAYGAAKCREVLGQLPDYVVVWAGGSMIKNVKSVIVPNTGGMKGIAAAVAAGIIAGDASKELEVISSVSREERNRIKQYGKRPEVPYKVFWEERVNEEVEEINARHFCVEMTFPWSWKSRLR